MNPENAASVPTLKEQNLRVFQKKPIPGLFFQPRFEPWFQMHKARGTLPDSIRHLDLREVYDFLGASMRTVHYYTDRPDPVQCRFSNKVKITEQKDRNCWKRRFDTPHGPLFDMQLLTLDGAWRIVEFPAKSRSDLRSLEWLFSQMTYSFDTNHFKEGASYIGDRGEPQFWVPKSPYFALAQQWMKFEDFFYALADDPLQVETLMRILDSSCDGLYREITGSGLVKILNFGENLDMAYLSIRYFQKYLLPWYWKRSGQLQNSGIYTHIHIDGKFRQLLPFLRDLPFDGLEALTPLPQGDVTLEEIQTHIAGKILLDGIPAVYFLDHYPCEVLQACVEEIVTRFQPALVLGISDELPEGGGDESFRRLEWVSGWCRSYLHT